MHDKDKLFDLEILKELQSIKELDGVRDVKCSVVGANDINVRVEVEKDCNIIPTLITLERKMYLSSKFKVVGIKPIKDGIKVLDKKDNTYEVKILTADKN